MFPLTHADDEMESLSSERSIPLPTEAAGAMNLERVRVSV